MLNLNRPPDRRVNLALIVGLFLVLVAVAWALRAGRVRSDLAPTPAPPGAAGPPGPTSAPGTPPSLPSPP
jgi:hypothetical protein